jgi:hypothetical protein
VFTNGKAKRRRAEKRAMEAEKKGGRKAGMQRIRMEGKRKKNPN